MSLRLFRTGRMRESNPGWLQSDSMDGQMWGRMGSGGPPGLQNRVRVGSASLSEFDSHALPPNFN